MGIPQPAVNINTAVVNKTYYIFNYKYQKNLTNQKKKKNNYELPDEIILIFVNLIYMLFHLFLIVIIVSVDFRLVIDHFFHFDAVK